MSIRLPTVRLRIDHQPRVSALVQWRPEMARDPAGEGAGAGIVRDVLPEHSSIQPKAAGQAVGGMLAGHHDLSGRETRGARHSPDCMPLASTR